MAHEQVRTLDEMAHLWPLDASWVALCCDNQLSAMSACAPSQVIPSQLNDTTHGDNRPCDNPKTQTRACVAGWMIQAGIALMTDGTQQVGFAAARIAEGQYIFATLQKGAVG